MTQLLTDVNMIKNDVNRLEIDPAGDDPWARRRTTASAESPDVRGGIGLPADEPAGETSCGGAICQPVLSGSAVI